MDDSQNPPPLLSPPLAYENKPFMDSPDGRILRILSEYEEPLARFRHLQIQDTVVFFGSARYPSRDAALARTEAAKLAVASAQDVNEALRTDLQAAAAGLEMSAYYEDARRLANMLTQWSASMNGRRRRFVVTTGGGGGIMEAANRGAHEAGGPTIGLNIRLPHEQHPNPYITPDLCFNFHYFFMRKYWFAYLAKALVVFPGGFGTFDEMFEMLTLAQTQKLAKKLLIIVYGRSYWNDAVNFRKLVESGSISAADLNLFRFADTPEEAYAHLHDGLTKYHLSGRLPESLEALPEIAKTLP